MWSPVILPGDQLVNDCFLTNSTSSECTGSVFHCCGHTPDKSKGGELLLPHDMRVHSVVTGKVQ